MTTTHTIAATRALTGMHLRRFIRSPQQAALVVIQQVMFLLIFRYVLGGAIQTPDATRYADYLAPGILVSGAVFAATRAAVTTAEDRALGFRDRVRSLPTPPWVDGLARWLADSLISTGAVTVTLAAAVAVGFRPSGSASELIGAAGILVAFTASVTAMFVALGHLASDVEAAQGLGFIAVPVTFISSAYVPTDGMPTWLATIADHQPITITIDTIRTLTLETPTGSSSATVSLLAAAAGIALAAVIAGGRDGAEA